MALHGIEQFAADRPIGNVITAGIDARGCKNIGRRRNCRMRTRVALSRECDRVLDNVLYFDAVIQDSIDK